MNSLDITKFLTTDIQKKLIKLKASESDGLVLNLFQTNNGRSLRFMHFDFECNGSVLALSNIDNTIFVINFITLKCWRLKAFALCSCIKVSEYNINELLIGKRNGVIEVVEIDTGISLGKLLGHQEPVASMSFAQSGNCVTSSRNEAIIWDMANYNKLQILALEKDCFLKFVLFVPVSNHILVCYKDDIIQLWQNGSFESLKQFHPSNWRNYTVKSLSISRNGKVMVISGYLPILAIFQLDIWKLLKLINLPNHINSVKQVQFIPQNFDAGCNKLLAILAGSGVIHFYNVESNTLISEMKLKCAISSFSMPCANAHYMACLLSNGEVEVHDINFYILKNEKTVAEKAREIMLKPGSKFTFYRYSKKLDITTKEQINSVLEIGKLKSIIKEYKEFPEAFRATIWERVLKLPNNRQQYNSIVNHVSVVAFEGLQEAFPLEDKVSIRCLRHVLSNICTWCPFFAQVEYLPYLLYPFVKIFHKKPISCFELCCSLIVNWCQHWFEYHPLPPVNVLAIIDNVLMEHDFQILEHFSQYNIKPVTYSWCLLETAFSEVLTANEWLVLWDHIFINEPGFLLCTVAAFILLQKKVILSLTTEAELSDFFHSQTALSARKLISKALHISANTMEKNNPRQYLNPFKCLECGSYPTFTQYPKDVVNFQVEHINLLEEQLKNVKDLKHYALKERERRYEGSEVQIRQEEERRMIEVEKACLEKIKSYQENLLSQQEELKRLRQELSDHEQEIIKKSRMKLTNRKNREKIDILNLLRDGLSVSEKINQVDMKNIEERYKLDDKDLHSNQDSDQSKGGGDYMPNMLEKLTLAHRETVKLKKDIQEAQSHLKPPKKSDIALAVSTMNDLISKIKAELENETLSSNYNSTTEHLKIYKLEKETKDLQERTSKLLRHMCDKRGGSGDGDCSPACSGQSCLNNDAQHSKTVRFSVNDL